MPERPDDDDSKLTSDIEEIWQHLADARGDVARERAEAAERTAEIEAIGDNLRKYAEKRKKQIAEHRRPRAADG